MKRLPFRVGLRLPCVLSTAGLDNQLAAVSQQGNVELALFRELFLSPSSSEESSATPKKGCSAIRAGYEHWRSSSCRQRTTITLGPPVCRFVTGHSQQYPLPVPVATPPSPQVLEKRHRQWNHHDDWIIVRVGCVAAPTHSSCIG